CNWIHSYLLMSLHSCTSFFFTAPPPTVLYTLSLHDALPIFSTSKARRCASDPTVTSPACSGWPRNSATACTPCPAAGAGGTSARSEEHTSELQSLRHLVCRLLLEKKKKRENRYQHDRTNIRL